MSSYNLEKLKGNKEGNNIAERRVLMKQVEIMRTHGGLKLKLMELK